MSGRQRARNAEDEDDEPGHELTTGRVDLGDEDRWDSSDAVLWIPDLSSDSGFSKFWVSRRERRSRRPVGFRR